jgi:quercetin dioxygenase-like cupin family protein
MPECSFPLQVVLPDEGFLSSLRILAGDESTHGLYFAFESETLAGELDVHAHARYDESEYVLSGEREIVIEDQTWRATSGFFALAPRHARHGMRTIGSAASRWLHVFSPAEIERYFVEREGMRAAGASLEQMSALRERYGVGESSTAQVAEPAYVSPHRHAGVVVGGTATRNSYALAEYFTLPEEDHAHAEQEEAFYVISGELVIEVDGVTLTLPPRSFALIPRKVGHRHITSRGTHLLGISSPGHTALHQPNEGF